MTAFSTTLAVRVGDINYGGHLGHDRLITLLHQARCDFLCALGFSELDCGGVALIMRYLAVDYLSEAFLGDALTFSVSVGEIKATRFRLHYRVSKGERCVAEASTLMVCFDYQARKVCALPGVAAEKLKEQQHGGA